MNFYTVYIISKSSPDKSVLIKEGFNWTNFFLGIFWSLHKKLWDLTLIHLLLIVTLITASSFYPTLILQLTILFVTALAITSFYANDLYRKKLLNAGYKEGDLIASNSTEKAFIEFLNRLNKK